MTVTIAVKDPVCGTNVNTKTAAGRTEYQGRTFFFCASKCKETFDLDPQQHLGRFAGTPTSGGCRCC
jgi:P-type Cu+ transporter